MKKNDLNQLFTINIFCSCIMESSQRRSGIPIPKSKSTLKKNLSKSSDDLLSDYSINDSHNQSGDLDLFTLLEENISLKEKSENLFTKNNFGE